MDDLGGKTPLFLVQHPCINKGYHHFKGEYHPFSSIFGKGISGKHSHLRHRYDLFKASVRCVWWRRRWVSPCSISFIPWEWCLRKAAPNMSGKEMRGKHGEFLVRPFSGCWFWKRHCNKYRILPSVWNALARDLFWPQNCADFEFASQLWAMRAIDIRINQHQIRYSIWGNAA